MARSNTNKPTLVDSLNAASNLGEVKTAIVACDNDELYAKSGYKIREVLEGCATKYRELSADIIPFLGNINRLTKNEDIEDLIRELKSSISLVVEGQFDDDEDDSPAGTQQGDILCNGNSEETAFTRAISQAPQDSAPRLIYADWLKEREADPVKAEKEQFIRVVDQLQNADTIIPFADALRLYIASKKPKAKLSKPLQDFVNDPTNIASPVELSDAYAKWLDEHEQVEKAAYIRLIETARDYNCIVPFPDTLSVPFEAQHAALAAPLQAFVHNPTNPESFDAVSLALTSLIESKPLGNLTTLEGQKQQFDFQLLTNQSLQYLTKDAETGSTGILDNDNHFYPYPTAKAIQDYINSIEGVQPDDQLIIEPFALPLDTKFERASEWMIRHRDLFPNGQLIARPIYTDPLYNSADTNGTLLYNPVRFTANHEGKTKADILADTQLNYPFPGYRVRIVPATSRAAAPLHLNRSAIDTLNPDHPAYLQVHQRQTPDEYLHLFLSHFVATKSLLDSGTYIRLSGTGLINSNGSVHEVSGVELLSWIPRLSFYWGDPGGTDGHTGFRPSRRERKKQNLTQSQSEESL